MKRKLVIAVVLLVVLVAACQQSPVAPTITSTYRGQLFGVITVLRDSLPDESKLEKFLPLDTWTTVPGGGEVKLSLLPTGEYEIRRKYPTDSLEIYLDSTRAEVHADGSFEVRGVQPGEHTLHFLVQGIELRAQKCKIVTDSIENIDITYDPMVCGKHTHQSATASSILCLDNNGVWPGGFTFSDCWTSLVLGNPAYTWMCWAEAMNVIHDHHGNIWCNGTHNCSLFVHGWNWNMQFWHRHYTMWWPSW